MNQRDRDLLRDHWVFLLDNVHVDGLLPVLFQARILSQDMVDRIDSEPTPKRRNFALLSTLQKRGSKAFGAFLDALDESGQGHVRERLRPSTVPSSSVAFPASPTSESTAEPSFNVQATPTDTFRTSRGGFLTQPQQDPSAEGSVSTLDEEFERRLLLRERLEDAASAEDLYRPTLSSTGLFRNVPRLDPPLSREETTEPATNGRGSSENLPPRPGSSAVRRFSTIFDIPVKKTKSIPLEMSVKLGTGDVYPNFSKPKGLCLIINIREFESASSDLETRLGTDKDAAALSWLFTEIGYEVIHAKNLDSDAFETALEDFAANPRHKTSDSTILVVLSHGNGRGVYAADELVVPFDRILDALDGHNCPNLVDKPKLFFFQACRGVKMQGGYDAADGADRQNGVNEPQNGAVVSGFSTPEDNSSSSSISKSDSFYGVDGDGDMSVPHQPSDSTDDGTSKSRANRSDMLISQSTIDGFKSLRHKEQGSWYVQAIVDVFSEFAAESDVLSLLTKVNRKVSAMTTDGQPRKQMPAPQYHLRRDFYFFPGYFEEDQRNAIQALFDIAANQPLPSA